MVISKIGFPEILADNEIAYYSMLQAVVEAVDHLAALRIVKKPNAVAFTLTPSSPKYTQLLLQEILSYHTAIGIQVTMSKSIRLSTTIHFEIIF